MKNALLEAKMIEKIYGKNSQSPYSRYNLEEHNLICKYVKQINSCIEHIDFESLYYDIEEKLVLTNWIDNLYYVVLNTKRYQRFLSIRCLSTKLICCLPTKKHIKQMSDKEIIKRYNILENLDIIPNCCVL